MGLKRVVVSGLGALTPIGNDIKSYWSGLKSGVSGADNITYFDTTKFKTQFACELKGYDSMDFFDRREVRKLDRFSQYAIVSSDEAIKDSGINNEKIDKTRVGVIWGSGIGGLKTFQEEVTNFVNGDGTPRYNPFFIPKMIPDIAAGVISIRHGFKGPNFATVSACASSANALIDGVNYIRLGYADAIVSGGSEAGIIKSGIGGFNAVQALSKRNDDPKTASRAFDLDRDGFVLGEGGGCVILEEMNHALKRGAKIYGEIVSCAESSDGYSLVSPSGDGAYNCMKKLSGLETVDYINAHGTSTPAGDISEIEAIAKAFGSEVPPISSTKSLTGHSLGAAGVHEIIYSLLMMKNNFLCGSHKIEELDPKAKPFPILKENIEKEINSFMSNSFGFGGTNGSIIIKKI